MNDEIVLFSYYKYGICHDRMYISNVLAEPYSIREHATQSLYFYKSNILKMVKNIEISISLKIFSILSMFAECNISLCLVLNNGKEYQFELPLCNENFSILEKFLELFPDTDFTKIVADLTRYKTLNMITEESRVQLDTLDNLLNKYPEQRLFAEIEG